MYYVKRLIIITLCLVLYACGDMKDDLKPSNSDHSPTTNQQANDFSVKTSLDADFVLSEYLVGGATPADIVVLYFTMWCPVCLAHTDHMYNTVIPQFNGRGTVVYALVDYVSGNVAATRASELANGYASTEFVTLSDVSQQVFNQFNGGMGVTVVIGRDGTILMSEDYRTGTHLQEILEQHLP